MAVGRRLGTTIEDLKVLNLPDNHLKRRINAKYTGVPHACRQHFANLVPGREAENDDGERLYTSVSGSLCRDYHVLLQTLVGVGASLYGGNSRTFQAHARWAEDSQLVGEAKLR
jgi:hypothetical protein